MFLWLILMILVLWIVLFRYRRRNLYRLAAKVPLYEGSVPILGISHKFGDGETMMSQVQNFSYSSMKHDGIVAFWIFHNLFFVVTNPVDMEYCLKTCLEKGVLVKFIRDALGNGSIFAPVAIWKPRRKVLAPAFSPRVVDSFINVFAKHSQLLVNKLSRNNNKEKIDMWPLLTAFSLDSITETTVGATLNQEDNQDSPLLIAVSNIMHLIVQRMFRPWLQPNWLFKWFPEFKVWAKNVGLGYGIINGIIKTKQEEIKNKKVSETQVVHNSDSASYEVTPILERLITPSGSTNGYTNIELSEEVMTLAIAGTETTATEMGFTMLLLAKYPEVQKKVYQELYAVFGHSNRLVEKDDLSKLKYLDSVLKETLRLYPSVPATIRRVDQDTKLPSGVVLPAGSNIISSIWGLHRDPKYWGPDAEDFNPDRFLPERLNLKYACSFIPFSYGQRNCVGYRYAMVSMKVALSTIFREYKIVDDRENGPAPKIRTTFCIMQMAAEGYHVALEKRKQVLT